MTSFPLTMTIEEWEKPCYALDKILGQIWSIGSLGDHPSRLQVHLSKIKPNDIPEKIPERTGLNDRWSKRYGVPQRKQKKCCLSTGEGDSAKITELKLCPLVHKGSWEEISESYGTFPNGDRRNLRQKTANVLVSQSVKDLDFLGDRAISSPHRSVSKFWSKIYDKRKLINPLKL